MRRPTLLVGAVVLALLGAGQAHAAPGPSVRWLCDAVSVEAGGLFSCTLPEVRRACRPIATLPVCRGIVPRFRAAAALDRAQQLPPNETSPAPPDPDPDCSQAESPGEADACRGQVDAAQSTATSRDTLGALGCDGADKCGTQPNAYPLDNYGLDKRIDTSGREMPKGVFLYAVHSMVDIIWQILLFLVRGMLAMVEAAFSVSGFAETGPLADGLDKGMRYLTTPWMLAGLAGLGLWGVWRGLAQRKFTSAFSGIGLSLLALMGAGAVFMNPSGLFSVSKTIDQATGDVFSAMGSIGPNPDSSVRGMSRSIFDAIAVPGFCALEFGDVTWCTKGTIPAGTPNLRPERCTPAPTFGMKCTEDTSVPTAKRPFDLFLQHPADGGAREEIYDEWKDRAGTREQEAVQMMRSAGTMKRPAVLLLILVGVVGALLLFGAIAFRLLSYSVLSIVLLLFGPVMLVAVCFGDSGRQAFLTWAKRLIGVIVGKLIYAALLAVVAITSAAVQVMGQSATGGWLVGWLLLTCMWWTVFLKREMFVEWLSAGAQRADDEGVGVARALGAAYFATRLGSLAAGGVSQATSGVRGRISGWRESAGRAADKRAHGQLSAQVTRQMDGELGRSRDVIAAHSRDREALAGVEREIDDEGRRLAAHEALRDSTSVGVFDKGGVHRQVAASKDRIDALLSERGTLLGRMDLREAGSLGAARANLARADRNEAATGRPHTAQEIEARIANMREDLGEPHLVGARTRAYRQAKHGVARGYAGLRHFEETPMSVLGAEGLPAIVSQERSESWVTRRFDGTLERHETARAPVPLTGSDISRADIRAEEWEAAGGELTADLERRVREARERARSALAATAGGSRARGRLMRTANREDHLRHAMGDVSAARDIMRLYRAKDAGRSRR